MTVSSPGKSSSLPVAANILQDVSISDGSTRGGRLTFLALDLPLHPQLLRQCLFLPKTSEPSPMHPAEKSRS